MTLIEWVKGWHVASVAIVLALVGYGVWRLTDNTTETWNIQNAIAGELGRQIGTPGELTVDCPETVEWEANEDFHCVAEDPDGNTIRVTVHMENDDGEYTWAVE